MWLMVFLGAAREVITEEEAAKAADALDALAMVMRGKRILSTFSPT